MEINKRFDLVIIVAPLYVCSSNSQAPAARRRWPRRALRYAEARAPELLRASGASPQNLATAQRLRWNQGRYATCNVNPPITIEAGAPGVLRYPPADSVSGNAERTNPGGFRPSDVDLVFPAGASCSNQSCRRPAGEQSGRRRKCRAVRKRQAGFAFAAMARSVWPCYRRCGCGSPCFAGLLVPGGRASQTPAKGRLFPFSRGGHGIFAATALGFQQPRLASTQTPVLF
jgi:hypothetical protein